VIPADLPRAGRHRWQPVRAGLVDMFLYDHEEFWFRDGHLLLRGNNGTGKSKVLALMLPFLFDGELAAARVEPDGDPAKRMEWNLLMGGRYDERLGYTWLEFGRVAEEGQATYVTIGCGIKAAQGRGIASRWFFLASGRPGVDFWLVAERGAVLTRERLIETLDGRGRVLDTADEYRRAVDERLFHLGPDRYAGLVNLLIQLRQPQLSKRPDEEKLSRALSQALRPVDQAILADIAQAFRDLEQQRDELRNIEETRAQVEAFLVSYRVYASVAARRLSQHVRSTHGAFQETQRGMAAARQKLETATAEDDAAKESAASIDLELTRSRSQAAELRDQREVRELDAAEAYAERTAAQSTEAAARKTDAEAEVAERRLAAEQARAAAQDGGRRLTAVIDRAAEHALLAGIDTRHSELLAPLVSSVATPADEPAVDAAESAAGRLVQDREDAIDHVRSLVEAVDEASRSLSDARGRLDEASRELDTASDEAAAADEAVLSATDGLVDAWRGFARAAVEVDMAELEDLLEGLRLWAATLDGEEPARAALADVARRAANALSEFRAEARGAQAQLEAERGVFRLEQARLHRGEDTAPPQPHTRDAASRALRDGAPFWQLVDFREHVTGGDRAGLEAGLEASGVLDAWLMPDGRLLDPSTHDAVVVSGAPAAANLGVMLMAAVDRVQSRAAAVADVAVEAVLAGIGLGSESADTWFDPSGRWRLGVTEGRWSKPAATFIGRGAREAERRRRLAEIEEELRRLDVAITAVAEQVERIEARQAALGREVSGAPGSEPLRQAHLVAALSRTRRAAAEVRVEQQTLLVDGRAAEVHAATEIRDANAADLNLSASLDGLDRARRALADYRATAGGLWPQVRGQGERLRTADTAMTAVARSEVAALGRRSEQDRAAQAASDAAGTLDGLRQRIGATVEQVRNRLASVQARIHALELEATGLNDRRLALSELIGAARTGQADLEAALTRHAEERAAAINSLQRLGSAGLIAIAVPGLELPEVPWAPEPAVRLARRVEQELTEVESGDAARERVDREVALRFKDLQDSVSAHGHSATADLVDGRLIVSITFQGQHRAPDELSGLLLDEIGHRDRLLDARERELLEEHLVNEVASHLQELISDGEEQVQRVNDELQSRPTSTGMRLRFRWAPRFDGPAGLAEARKRLLRQVSDAWSLEDRGAVSTFLQQQILAVRTANESATWLEQLTEAFDYRQWHRFQIERWQDGAWRAATDPSSSGERVLTVTVPLFAAASAHYRSAHELAPRLVMLDEAFAGVDDDSRAKCMGLLDTFDLDFVMTSEREWGCYPTIGGLAIHQLARREGIDAVHITRWEWDGRTRTRVEPDLPPALAPGSNGNGLIAGEP